MTPTRRSFIAAGAAALVAGCSVRKSQASAPPEVNGAIFEAALAEAERARGGRLGAFILNTGTGAAIGFRHDERFGQCSTFKLSLAAFVLREGAAGRLRLDEVLPYTKADLLPHSPDTTANLGAGGMTIAALAEAAQITSDNAAANLLLRRIGGPLVLTAFWRELGDTTSRLDRYEPALNLVPPGELRDTITPEGIARSAARFIVGDVLPADERARLNNWLARTETGARRIRAALPAGWRGGDKTGTGIAPGLANKYNDIAVLYPPGGAAPLVVTAFYEASGYSKTMTPEDESVLKRVGQIAAEWATAK